MKIKNLKAEKIDDFFKVIEQCTGNVYLVSPNMNINLKSKIANYISLVNLCAAGIDEINEIEVVASDRKDIDRLYDFLKLN